jgi:hypothetical protein
MNAAFWWYGLSLIVGYLLWISVLFWMPERWWKLPAIVIGANALAATIYLVYML